MLDLFYKRKTEVVRESIEHASLALRIYKSCIMCKKKKKKTIIKRGEILPIQDQTADLAER
jgi:hypothetical protein